MSQRWRSKGPELGQESAAELQARLGRAHWIRRLPSSPRSAVWLAEFDGSPAVVKQIVAGPDAQHRYGREVTALRLAARMNPPVVPAVLATLPRVRLLVLERLTDKRPRAGWVRLWATGLARLHASTGPADAGSLPRWRGPGPADVRAFLSLAAALAGPLPDPVLDEVAGELERLLVRLDQRTGHALLHGDPCPGNDLYAEGAVRFLDLEGAALGNGLVELAYLRIGFPTCWCATSVAEAELQAAEADYRQVFRSLTGNEPAGDLTDACVGWLISGDALVERALRGTPEHPSAHLTAVLQQDWTWGTATARQRLAHRLAVVAGLCADRDDLAATGRLCTAVRAGLRQRWPTPAPLPSTRPS